MTFRPGRQGRAVPVSTRRRKQRLALSIAGTYHQRMRARSRHWPRGADIGGSPQMYTLCRCSACAMRAASRIFTSRYRLPLPLKQLGSRIQHALLLALVLSWMHSLSLGGPPQGMPRPLCQQRRLRTPTLMQRIRERVRLPWQKLPRNLVLLHRNFLRVVLSRTTGPQPGGNWCRARATVKVRLKPGVHRLS